jgi:cytochrome c oxidase accessory protein FixG
MIIAYDEKRGEPRGKLGKTDGSCVDCSMCVQVCPMGIDIRDGLQLECIACAACIDACDKVMDRTRQPRGLVRYSSLSGRHRLTRPRVLVYGALYLALIGLFLYLATHRQMLAVEAVRSSSLYTTTPDGRVANSYTLHLINRQDHPVRVTLSLDGLPQGELIAPLGNPVDLPPASVLARPVLVACPPGSRPVIPFKILAEEASCETTFVGPVR